MRLHRLSMTAIGPFLGCVEIDLARFGASGLFLIEGPTGSGKSTILDSISFALYGKLAQSSAVIERMKSHHAPPGAEPVVELTFETQSGLYRIRRTPSYRRAKKRGAGTTLANMTVKLWRLNSPDDPVGELLSNNLGDAEDEITRAVGLTHAQFVQTVLLPQGEFASFLRADTNAKRALLQRLFGTELLARTQESLVEGRRTAEQRRAQAVASVRHSVHAFAGAVGLPDEQTAQLAEHAEGVDRSALDDDLASVLGELAELQSRAASEHEAASAHRLLTDATMQHSQHVARRRQLRDRLRDERDQLVVAEISIAAIRNELAEAERALTVVPAAEALDAAIRQSNEAQDAQREASAELPNVLCDTSESRLREVAAEHRMTVGTLTAELRREQQLARLHVEHEQLLANRAELVAVLEHANRKRAKLPIQLAQLTEARHASQLASDQVPGLSAERDRALGRLLAARQAEVAAREAADNQQLAREVFEAAEHQSVRLETLRLSWRANIASQLGLALQIGDPCAVCGSIEHPRPAQPAVGDVSQDQVTHAENELRRMRIDVERLRDELTAQQLQLNQLQLQADSLTPELAEARLDRAASALAEAEKRASELTGIVAQAARVEGEIAELDNELQVVTVTESRLAERASALTETIERDELAVRQARCGFATVAERVSELVAQIDVIERAAHASGNARSAVANAVAAGDVFMTALTDADFADQQSWQSARRSNTVIVTLRRALTEHDERVLTVAVQLSAPELNDAELDGEQPDLVSLADTAQRAADAERVAAQAHGATNQRYTEAIAQADSVGAAVLQSATVLTETATAIRIGNLVAGFGENQLKMELTTYVLVRRFAEIVAAANSQLRHISAGRYELEHTDARNGNARSGLGLQVLDLHTGQARDPGTLSGGETFYVSLSLALGLADVVRAESGGIDLGTLLIDEGFGTLDAEVLDQVIVVLDGLRAGGRAVGVVSHVSELKMRITDRIQVTRGVDGASRVLTTV